MAAAPAAPAVDWVWWGGVTLTGSFGSSWEGEGGFGSIGFAW